MTERFVIESDFGVNKKPRKLQVQIKELTEWGYIVEWNCGKNQVIKLIGWGEEYA